MLRQMYVIMVKVLVFVEVGGREQSSQICVTPWYVSTGGIIFYTKKNRFENSCTWDGHDKKYSSRGVRKKKDEVI